MKHKKLISAIMAIALLGTMQTMMVGAEEVETSDAEVVAMTEAPATTQIITTEEPVSTSTVASIATTQAVESTQEETQTTEELENAPTDAPDVSSTTSIVTTVTSMTTESATTATTVKEIISSDLKAPEIGDFKITDPSGEEGGNGDSAVISWNAVEGADGYQIYRTEISRGQEDTPISYTFDVKGTSYKTGDSTRQYKETIKVRAFKLVNDERVYSAWSAEKTVYMNGMKEETLTTTAGASTTTKTTTTTAKATTTTAKSTTSTDGKTASPKTGDNIIKIALIGAGAAGLVAVALVATKKKKD